MAWQSLVAVARKMIRLLAAGPLEPAELTASCAEIERLKLS